MGFIGTTIENIGLEIDSISKTIKNKVADINQVWSGDAQQGFNEAHNEVCQKAKSTMSKIQSMQSLVRSLENSITAADRDIAAKKAAAAALARNSHRR